uniref:ABC-type branched-chain amino acid transport system, substrate-binding protein n=1 Tax=Candidatus Kentrum sp. MB TaxID=2138164 RepID=A0A450XYF9_9GAMM|nr:MAG: ABC-type branched-chain amino acid transport system, substrate-binding protein [Candidatus Kentron sp. MB]VFK76659.1 MAG: ABC-type branched-chain amino acid transport system, substrate-binding protein [Candidatus Kentron sp. MB]
MPNTTCFIYPLPARGKIDGKRMALGGVMGSVCRMLVGIGCVFFLMAMAMTVSGEVTPDNVWARDVCRYPDGFSLEDRTDSIVVALAAPLRTEKGQEMLRGSRLRMDEFNDTEEIAGKRIVLLVCDDGLAHGLEHGKGEEGKRWEALAHRIADSEALVVVGHRSSNASIAAGGVYEAKRIPAITGTAQADDVTRGNDWYFSMIPQSSLYSTHIVHYATQLLGHKRFGIVYVDNPFGKGLKNSFEDALLEDEMERPKIWRLPEGRERDKRIPEIVRELGGKGLDAVFLAVDDKNVVPLIETMKDRSVDIPVLGGANMSKTSFPLLFEGFSKERATPGYYTDGILAPAYFMFDVAGRGADIFVNRYEARFPEYKADTGAISTYDAMGLALEAIKKSYAQGNNKEERRARVRDYIVGLHKESGNFYEGAMGKVFFDARGNAVRDIPIALLWNREVISAPAQLAEITDPKRLDSLKKTSARDRESDGTKGPIFKIASRDKTEFFQGIDAVYVGVRINRIDNIDAEDLTYDLDAYLWFRFNNDPELDLRVSGDEPEEDTEKKYLVMEEGRERSPEEGWKDGGKRYLVVKESEQGQEPENEEGYLGNIEFLNVVGEPGIVREESVAPGPRIGEMGYSLYRIQGRFRSLFDPEFYTYGERTLELNFRHKRLPRERLIFVQDVLGIDETEGNTESVRKRILPPFSGWEIKEISYYPDTMDTPTLGNPELFGKRSDKVEFSRYNANVTIQKIGFSIMGISPSRFLLHFMGLVLVTMVLLLLYLKHNKHIKRPWFTHPAIYVLFLIGGEMALLYWNAGNMNLYYLNFITKTMDILWWVILGIVLSFTVNVFMFMPLERSAGRKIPSIITRTTAFSIHLFMLFGIFAFVFDYKVTSLLATSGLLAMILGLALQTNLSNIFSGIAINLERPFRVGDWVKIGDFDEGRVINVTWRSIRIRTTNNHIISVPNSTAAETVTHNFTPHPIEKRQENSALIGDKDYFTLRLIVQTRSEEDPSRVKFLINEVVREGASEEKGILLEPAPIISLLSIREHSGGGFVAEYEVMVSIEDYEKKDLYSDRIWHGIWNRLSDTKGLPSAFVGA